MNLRTLKQLLDVKNRQELYLEILDFLDSLNDIETINCQIHQTSEGKIPIVSISNLSHEDEIESVKLFVGAQHNEYNGLFGILEFLKKIQNNQVRFSNQIIKNQVLIFAPLMNTYGFLYPQKENKSGCKSGMTYS